MNFNVVFNDTLKVPVVNRLKKRPTWIEQVLDRAVSVSQKRNVFFSPGKGILLLARVCWCEL